MNVCIVGTGYVGLVSAACYAEMGNDVCCVDVDPGVVNTLKNGKIHIYEPGLESIVKRNVEDGRLNFTTDLAEGIENALFVFNCVGTPPKEDGSCDLSYVFQVASQVGKTMKDYKIIINKSTVPVGTADQVRQIVAEELGRRNISIEFDVVSNPEFLKEGDAINDFMKPDRVVIGTDNVRTSKLLETLYAPFARNRQKLIIMSVRSAEMTKYAANCMLATKISFMNELSNICDKLGADIKDVRNGIGSDHRIGYHFIYPGVGYGGSCFPKDVKALINTARENDYNPELIIAVDEVNKRQKQVLVTKIKQYFTNSGGVKDKILALWGLAFKANTDDIRDAPSLSMINSLTELGMSIRAYDPEAGDNVKKIYENNSSIEILDKQYDVLEGASALAVVTDWNQFRNPDFVRIKKMLTNPVIFDGRNLYSTTLLEKNGFLYYSIGRPGVNEKIEK